MSKEDEMTTLSVTKRCRRKLGEKCPKDDTFSDFIEHLVDARK